MPNLGFIIRSKIKHLSNKDSNANNVPDAGPGNNKKTRIINLKLMLTQVNLW